MSIKIKLADLVIEGPSKNILVIEALNILSEGKVSLTTGLKFKKLMRCIEPIIADFQQLRFKLIKENGIEKKDDNNNIIGYEPSPDKMEFVISEIQKAIDSEIELDIDKFKIQEFDEIKLSSNQALLIDWLFE